MNVVQGFFVSAFIKNYEDGDGGAKKRTSSRR